MDVHEVVRRWADAVSKWDMEAFGAMYAADAVLYTPLTPQGVRGREGIQKYEGSIAAAFPGATLKTAAILSGGDTIAVDWEYSGKHTGPLVGPEGTVPPTDRSLTLRGASFLQLAAKGRIAEERRYYDAGSLFDQLGLK